jgi:copper chaperone
VQEVLDLPIMGGSKVHASTTHPLDNGMLTFRVGDMTCGHCASTITKAMKAVDTDAKVSIDLGAHLVQVESARADAKKFGEALAEAGYAPVQVEIRPASAADARAAGGGCCSSGACRCG